ncbi:MAG: hypothetical protein ACRD16_15785 [Thermoanaerobaculia bacterium]
MTESLCYAFSRPEKMRSEGSTRNVLLWFGVAILLGASARRIAQLGPLTLSRPRTVVSHSEARFEEPLLLFLSRIASSTPPGSTVAIVAPSGQSPENWLNYMVAIGQLPGRRVLFEARFVPPAAGGETPRFAACYEGEFSDARFREIQRFPEGRLYERVP